MTQPNLTLDWSRVQRAAAAKQELLNKSLATGGLKTPELSAAVERFNAVFGTLSQQERQAVNQLT